MPSYAPATYVSSTYELLVVLPVLLFRSCGFRGDKVCRIEAILHIVLSLSAMMLHLMDCLIAVMKPCLLYTSDAADDHH